MPKPKFGRRQEYYPGTTIPLKAADLFLDEEGRFTAVCESPRYENRCGVPMFLIIPELRLSWMGITRNKFKLIVRDCMKREAIFDATQLSDMSWRGVRRGRGGLHPYVELSLTGHVGEIPDHFRFFDNEKHFERVVDRWKLMTQAFT